MGICIVYGCQAAGELRSYEPLAENSVGWGESSKLAQEPGPEHELHGLLDQRSLAEDPPVIRLARLVPEHFVAHVGVRRAAGEDVVGILSA